MRDRLIELLKTPVTAQLMSSKMNWKQFVEAVYSHIADNLLANGVIVPPCKVGDAVWLVCKIYADVEGVEKHSIFKGEVSSVSSEPEGLWAYCRYEDGLTFWHKCVEDFGKIVFLTKEDAEQALKEREHNDR